MSRASLSYGIGFYESLRSGSRASADVIVPMVLDMLAVESVLDVGCGTGSWLSAFARCGVGEIFGVDRDVPTEMLEIDPDSYCAVDLAAPFTLARRFDLVMSLEVAEHLPTMAADDFVANLALHGDAILFSAAVPGQGGTHHVNEQLLSSWVERFAQHGYALFDLIRARCWDDPRVECWYRQNVVLFARKQPAERLARLPAPCMPIDIVHPACFAQVRMVPPLGIWAFARQRLHRAGKALYTRTRGLTAG